MKLLIRRSAGRGRHPAGFAARSGKPAATLSARLFSPQARFACLAGFLVAVFLLGGGARGDIASLVLLRPLAVVVCGYAVVTLDRATVAAHRGIVGWFAAVVALVAAQLVPLPPALWHALPGHALLVAVDAATGNGDAWRSLAIVPDDAFNALYSLAVPAAVLLLGIQLSQQDRNRLLPWLIGLGIASGLLGLLQAIGPSQGALYFYRITNPGAPVGLFSNRNHAALFLACLAPLAAAWLLDNPGDRRRLIVGLAATAVLTPLAIAGGSRAGLVVAVLGLGGAALMLYRGKFTGGDRRFVTRAAGTAAAVLVVLSAAFVFFARSASVDRLLADEQGGDLRFRAWPVVMDVARDYFPWGSGAGSFVTAFQIREPLELLKPTYFNHAHNDLLELYVTTGVLGLILLGIALAGFAFAGWAAWRKEPATRGASGVDARQARTLARTASLILMLIALASLVDYPLRTPSIGAFAMLQWLWLRPRPDAAGFASAAELDNAGPGRRANRPADKKVEHAST